MWWVLAVAGCGAFAPEVDEAGQARAVPPTIARPPYMIVGEPAVIEVSGVGGATRAALWGSRTGTGITCLGPAFCLGLDRARFITTVNSPTDPLQVTFTPPATSREMMWLQAGAQGPGNDAAASDIVRIPTLTPTADHDRDGLTNIEEHTFGLDPLVADMDADGLNDAAELDRGTDPRVADTDDDGLRDGAEVRRGTDPLLPDTDGDGLEDGQEVTLGTDPTLADTDGDGITDADEVDAGTDPLAAWDPARDTGLDTDIANLCPPGEIVNCFGACAENTLDDGRCDGAFDCPRFSFDHGACEAGPPEGACAPGSVRACDGTCITPPGPADGVCDAALDCARFDWDDGDCGVPNGTTLRQYVDVDDPTGADVLDGVAVLEGTLRIGAGAPAVIDLPMLSDVVEIVVESDTLTSLRLPGLRSVRRGVTVHAPALTTLDLSGLRTVGANIELTAPALHDLDLTHLTQVGDHLLLHDLQSLSSLALPELTAIAGRAELGPMARGGVLTAPLLTRIGTLLRVTGGPDGIMLPQLTDCPHIQQEQAQTVVLEVPALRTGRLFVSAPRLDRVNLSVGEEVEVRGAFTRPATLDFAAATRLPRLVAPGAGSTVLLPSVTTSPGTPRFTGGGYRIHLPHLTAALPLGTLQVDALYAPQTPAIRGAVIVANGGELDVSAATEINNLILGAGVQPDLRALAWVQNLTARSFLTLPALTAAGGLRVDAGADAPVLQRLGSLTTSGPTSLPALTTMAGGLETSVDLTLPAVTTFHMARIRTTQGASVTLPALRTFGQLHQLTEVTMSAGSVLHMPEVRSMHSVWTTTGIDLDAPRLASTDEVTIACGANDVVAAGFTHVTSVWIGGRRWQNGGREPQGTCARSVAFPDLVVAGSLRVTAPGAHAVDLPALTDVGTLYVEATGLTRWTVPVLTRAGQTAAVQGYGIDIVHGTAPLDLDFPRLETADALRILTSPGVRSLQLPVLRSVGALLFSEAGNVAWGGVLTNTPTPPAGTFALDLPALETADDLFILHDRRITSVSLPSLTHVSGFLRFHDVPNLTSIDAPLLTTTAPTAQINLVNTPAATTLNLPSLTDAGRVALGNTGLSALWLPSLLSLGDDLSAWDNPGLTAIDAPGLLTVADLYLDGNHALTALDLPSLIDADTITVLDHPALNACPLFAQLPQVPVTTDQTCTP